MRPRLTTERSSTHHLLKVQRHALGSYELGSLTVTTKQMSVIQIDSDVT
jgi:hypothetical protein